MTATLPLALVAGLGLGVGLWAFVARLPQLGARRLTARVAPHVLDVSAEARALRRTGADDPASVLASVAGPVLERARRGLASVLGGDAAVTRRLRQAGVPLTVGRFRSRQLLSAVVGAVLGLALALVLGSTTAIPGSVGVAAGALVTIGALVAPEQLLARRAKARLARASSELPTVLEFMSLALVAGETIRDALHRVARIGSGELSAEFARMMAEVALGVPLTDALRDVAASLDLPALSRTVEQLVAAIERGSPLVEVLRAQAQDSRDDAKRLLLESAGKKEVAMLVPLVFLILPVTIVFAIFPATLVLEVGF